MLVVRDKYSKIILGWSIEHNCACLESFFKCVLVIWSTRYDLVSGKNVFYDHLRVFGWRVNIVGFFAMT